MPNDINVNVDASGATNGDPTLLPPTVPGKLVKTTTTQTPTVTKGPWQRLALSLLGIGIIYLVWERSTNHLYSLPDHSIAAFTSLSTNVFYSIAVIVVFAITGKLVWDWKNSTAQTVVETAQHISQDIKQKIDSTETINYTDHTPTNMKEDDYTLDPKK